MTQTQQLLKDQSLTLVKEIAEDECSAIQGIGGESELGSCGTQPDITFVVGVLYKYLENLEGLTGKQWSRYFVTCRYKGMEVTYGGATRGL